MNASAGWMVSAAIVLCLAAPASAAYESDSESGASESVPASTEDFSKITDVERYLEGRTTYTTLAMIRNVSTALHNDHLKMQQQMDELKRRVQQLTDEVRRLSSGSHP